MHEPGLIAFKVLTIPTTGWRAMTIPQMAHYLGDLRAIYGVAENNNADEEPSRLILEAWLGANVGYVKDTKVFE
uniref:Uncharacterized protein n=1 Tax=Panagrolaimus davidi TaxID=227884 RepID=A0A914QYW4_9BILA